MKEKWLVFSAKFEAFEPRERVLLAGAVLAFVYFLWEFTFYNSRVEAREILEAQQQTAQQSLVRAQAEQKVLSGLLARDPFANLRRELTALQQSTAELDVKLQGLSAGLVSPADLPLVLREVLNARPRVRLLSLQTLPAEEITLQPKSTVAAAVIAADQPEPSAARLYKHGVNIVLESNFAATLEYLQALEKADWQFYWDNLQYRVKNYPLAHISLDVYTLSAVGGGLHATN